MRVVYFTSEQAITAVEVDELHVAKRDKQWAFILKGAAVHIHADWQGDDFLPAAKSALKGEIVDLTKFGQSRSVGYSTNVVR